MLQSCDRSLGGTQFLVPSPQFESKENNFLFARTLSEEQPQPRPSDPSVGRQVVAEPITSFDRNLELLAEFTRALGLNIAVPDEDAEDFYSQIPDPE
jgi:hypothetical protein